MCEDAPCCGCCGVTPGETEYDPSEMMEAERYWPGDGSGGDDLADYNANEVEDYRDE